MLRVVNPVLVSNRSSPAMAATAHCLAVRTITEWFWTVSALTRVTFPDILGNSIAQFRLKITSYDKTPAWPTESATTSTGPSEGSN